jgi:hypothetical protein
MKTLFGMIAVVAMVAGLSAGCGKADTDTPAVVDSDKAETAENWEPETAGEEAHDEHDGHDHSGHNH